MMMMTIMLMMNDDDDVDAYDNVDDYVGDE